MVKNPQHTSMEYGRIKKITLHLRDYENTYYNSIKFDKIITYDGKYHEVDKGQSNGLFDDKMIQVSEKFIEKLIHENGRV